MAALKDLTESLNTAVWGGVIIRVIVSSAVESVCVCVCVCSSPIWVDENTDIGICCPSLNTTSMKKDIMSVDCELTI